MDNRSSELGTLPAEHLPTGQLSDTPNMYAMQPVAGVPAQTMPQPAMPYGAPMHVPQYRPPVMAPLAIPSDRLAGFLKGPARMRLIAAYPVITGYQTTQEEVSTLTYYQARGWMQFLADVTMPLFIWYKSVKPMTPEQIEFASQGNEAVAARLQRFYGKGWGWPTPARVLAVLGTWVALRVFSGWQEEVIFEQIEKLQTPLGNYARYLVYEGRKGAEHGMVQVPHPPFTFPIPQAAPPSYNNGFAQQPPQNDQFIPPQPQTTSSF